MHTIDSGDLAHTAQEVDNICHPFLHSRGLAYFQFKRIYRTDSFIILANRSDLFKDFLEEAFKESSPYVSPYTRLSSTYFWDESLPAVRLSYLKEKFGIYHGITLLNRRKDFYDCATFARSKPHPLPFAYYVDILKELQKLAELFPIKGRLLIEKAPEYPVKILTSEQGKERKSFFLPKRSTRFRIREDGENYITTYEALCVQLLDEGKTYKEIGSILSVAPSTIKMHLKRLRARTGLTKQELILQSFQTPNNHGFYLEKEEHQHAVLREKKRTK